MQVVVCNIISLVLQAPLYTLMLVLYARYDIDDPRLEGDAEHGTAGPVPCGCASVLGVPMITPPLLIAVLFSCCRAGVRHRVAETQSIRVDCVCCIVDLGHHFYVGVLSPARPVSCGHGALRPSDGHSECVSDGGAMVAADLHDTCSENGTWSPSSGFLPAVLRASGAIRECTQLILQFLSLFFSTCRHCCRRVT